MHQETSPPLPYPSPLTLHTPGYNTRQSCHQEGKPVPSEPSLNDRYLALIDQIVEATLKGEVRSKEQVYQQLRQDVAVGTGEVFERSLATRLMETQAAAEDNSSEIKQAKAMRRLRAMKTIQSEWQRCQETHRVTGVLATATQAILAAPDRYVTWLRYCDPNLESSLTLEQLKQLAQALSLAAQNATEADSQQELQTLVIGIQQGLAAWTELSDYLVSWLYDSSAGIGFETPGQRGPWQLWSDKSTHLVPHLLFKALTMEQPIATVIQQQPINASDWVELVVLLQCIQRGLVNWFEQQQYDADWGKRQAIATFLSFSVLWNQLSAAFESLPSLRDGTELLQGCFQVLLQLLRTFAQKPYFPLYGGVFALFSSQSLRDALSYLDAPLKRVEGTQEKARILTLIGYSQQAIGQYDRALAFHQQALEMAQTFADSACQIANLNHLSRTYGSLKQYATAIDASQRALILARQQGDRLGEANALTNLGYSEVLSARSLEWVDAEQYESAIGYLQRGLKLSESLGDRQSLSLCYNSLGMAYVALEQPETAVSYLEQGIQAALQSGDLYLQGLNLVYLAEAHYSQGNRDTALYTACLAMYGLHQIGAKEWRQAAGLLVILQGQLGDAEFEQIKARYRSAILRTIGVDGYDYLGELLQDYRR